MAKGRHFFVCKDGNALPQWLKLPGKVECVAANRLSNLSILPSDIVWLRLPPILSQETPKNDNLELIKRVSRVTLCIVMADIPTDADALAAFAAGAKGYCNSHSNSRVLKLIVNVVQDGGLWIGESLMSRLVVGVGKTIDEHAHKKSSSELLKSLTDREREVAEVIAGGASNKEVARLLYISERTVKAHVSTLFNKFDVRDRLQLTIKIKMLR